MFASLLVFLVFLLQCPSRLSNVDLTSSAYVLIARPNLIATATYQFVSHPTVVSYPDPLVSYPNPLVSYSDPLVSYPDPLVSYPDPPSTWKEESGSIK